LPPCADDGEAGRETDEVKAIVHVTSAPRLPAAPPHALLDLVEKTLDDGKAEDVVVIDLNGKSSIADYMVVATGRSQRQVVALAEHLRQAIDNRPEQKHRPGPSIEGLRQGDWVLIDAGDVIVHVFRPEVRAYYNLEKMWGDQLAEVQPGMSSSPLTA
jgi:ribosome-associated protein